MKPLKKKSCTLKLARLAAVCLTTFLSSQSHGQSPNPSAAPEQKSRVIFHYTPTFKPHLLTENALHYSNALNDPAYRPTLYKEGSTILKLSSWKSHASLKPADTTLQAIRTINLPPQKKELQIQVELQGVNPPTAKGFKKEATKLSIYFHAGEYKSRGEKKVYPSREWKTETLSLPIPEGADKAILELTAADGGEISTKNWKIQIP